MLEGTGLCCIDILSTVIGLYTVILRYKVGLHLETNILYTKKSALRVDYVHLTLTFGMPNYLCLNSVCSEFVDIQCDSEFYTVHFFFIQFVDINQALVSDNRLNYAPLNRIMPMLPRLE